MINEIKKSILNKFPFQLQDMGKKELHLFLDNHITPLSITDFVVGELTPDKEVTVLISTANKIGEMVFYRNDLDDNMFQCIFRIFSIKQITHLEILSFGNSWAKLLIESKDMVSINFMYELNDHDAIRFVQRLLLINP